MDGQAKRKLCRILSEILICGDCAEFAYVRMPLMWNGHLLLHDHNIVC